MADQGSLDFLLESSSPTVPGRFSWLRRSMQSVYGTINSPLITSCLGFSGCTYPLSSKP
jgi:hypothetical protein